LVDISRWVSVGSDLKYDARRDLDDVGAKCVQGVRPFHLCNVIDIAPSTESDFHTIFGNA